MRPQTLTYDTFLRVSKYPGIWVFDFSIMRTAVAALCDCITGSYDTIMRGSEVWRLWHFKFCIMQMAAWGDRKTVSCNILLRESKFRRIRLSELLHKTHGSVMQMRNDVIWHIFEGVKFWKHRLFSFCIMQKAAICDCKTVLYDNFVEELGARSCWLSDFYSIQIAA